MYKDFTVPRSSMYQMYEPVYEFVDHTGLLSSYAEFGTSCKNSPVGRFKMGPSP
jgi:hypothetical protein